MSNALSGSGKTPRNAVSFRLGVMLRRVAAVAASSVASQLLTGGLYILAARSVGPSEFGRVVSVLAVSTVSVVVFDFGLCSMRVRDVAQSLISLGDAIAEERKKRLIIPFPLAIVAGISFVSTKDVGAATVVSFSFWAAWEALLSNSFLRSQEKFATMIGCAVASRAVSLAIFFVFSHSNDSRIFLLCVLLGFSAEALLGRVLLGNFQQTAKPLAGILSLQKSAAAYGLSSLANSAQQLDTPIVNLSAGSLEAGLYAAAGRLIGPMNFLSSALSSVASPWLARAQEDHELRLREERKVLLTASGITVAPILLLFVGPRVLPLLLGESFSRSGPVFAILAVGASVTCLAQGFIIVVQGRRLQKQVAVCTLVGIVVGLLLTAVLGAIAGATGAAWGLTISQITILILVSRVYFTARKKEQLTPLSRRGKE